MLLRSLNVKKMLFNVKVKCDFQNYIDINQPKENTRSVLYQEICLYSRSLFFFLRNEVINLVMRNYAESVCVYVWERENEK